MSESVDTSILVVTYNHERYIEQAIKSLVAQKTKYKFEVLIGDDGSTDRTAHIIKKYAAQYPDLIRPYFQKENIGATKNSYALLQRARGKYIAFCDGDDVWSQTDRMERQTDFLNAHEEYAAVCGRCGLMNESNERILENTIDKRQIFWAFDQKIFTGEDFEDWKMPGHISAVMGRNVYGKMDCSILWKAHDIVGDRTFVLFFVMQGPIYCSSKEESCYRIQKEGNNFVAAYTNRNFRYEDYKMMQRLEKYANRFGYALNLGKIKEERFVGAVVLSMKAPSLENRKVVQSIMKSSGRRMRYELIKLKVIVLKTIYWHVLHTDKLIKI